MPDEAELRLQNYPAVTKQPVFPYDSYAEETQQLHSITVEETIRVAINEDGLPDPQFQTYTKVVEWLQSLEHKTGTKYLRQFLISGIAYFISLPVILAELVRVVKKKRNRVILLEITDFPAQQTWFEGGNVKRARPLGWYSWQIEINQKLYQTDVTFVEFTHTIIYPPDARDWIFVYQNVNGVSAVASPYEFP
jgi:hypothetical protein